MTTEKKSYASSFRAMVAAFIAAEDDLFGSGRVWRPSNDQQERFLAEVYPSHYAEAGKITEVDRITAWSADPINQRLKEWGMDIKLEPFGPDTFGFAARMKIALRWFQEGREVPLVSQDGSLVLDPAGRPYQAAHIEGGYTQKGPAVAFRTSKRHGEPIATLLTKTDDLVHITKFDEDLDAFDLLARSKEILADAKPIRDFGGVVFPFTNLDVQPDVKWLLGMKTTTATMGEAEMVQAVQQFKLQMNHKGVVVQDAFAGAAVLECMVMTKPDLCIDGSYLFVLERPGMSQPVCAAVVRPESFADPGDLGL